MNLVSDVVFDWALSLITGIVAGIWLVWDAIKIFNLRNADGTDPTVHDKRFGYSIGVVIGLVGVIGVLKHHLG